MKTKVMYHSRSGNTKKIADAIAQAIGQDAEAIPPDYPLENVGLLFLGAAVYAGKVDKKMEEFIRTLNSSRVKNVAMFGTNGGNENYFNSMRELLKAQGINVLEEVYSCRGKFFLFFNRKHPNEEDIRKAQEFAKAVYEKVDRI
jgi:flavodoxin